MRRTLILALALAASAGAASAHHSYGMFDITKEMTISGVVNRFDWTNPHSWLHVTVGDGPAAQSWDLEMASPGILARTGWKRTSLKSGDKVQILINPLRDGTPGGSLLGLTTADGQRFGSLAYRAKGASK